jgi:hypothetical protein
VLTLEGKRRQAGRRRTTMVVGPIRKEWRGSGGLPCDVRWRGMCGSRSQSSWWHRLAPEIDELDESGKGTPAVAHGSVTAGGARAARLGFGWDLGVAVAVLA